MSTEQKTAPAEGGLRPCAAARRWIEGHHDARAEKQAIVVRQPDGQMAIRESELKFIKDKYPLLGLPLVLGRGDLFGLHGGGRKGA